MKTSMPAAFAAAAGALLLIAQPAHAQPVWTDIMNYTGYTNMASATYWEFSNQDAGGYVEVAGTDIATYPNLSVPGLSSGTPATGASASFCGSSVTTPVQFLESGEGSGIKGVGFLGTFGGSSIPGGDFSAGAWLFESVFFGEVQCYNNEREYGFFYNPYGNGVWVYWGTNENTSSVVQAQTLMTGVNANTEYYYEMYPEVVGSSCGFQVTVLDTSFNTVYSQYLDVNTNNYPSGTITGADSGWCSNIASSSGDTGYVSANAEYSPTISPLPSTINLNMLRVFVGK